jgi:hypothetical protein
LRSADDAAEALNMDGGSRRERKRVKALEKCSEESVRAVHFRV